MKILSLVSTQIREENAEFKSTVALQINAYLSRGKAHHYNCCSNQQRHMVVKYAVKDLY